MQHAKALWWIKRDFRLTDNQALVQAVKASASVLPVFVCEPQVITSTETSSLHLHAQYTALRALRAQLLDIGANVAVLSDDLPNAFAKLHEEYAFTAIYSHQETGSDVTYRRDLNVQKWCNEHGIAWYEFSQNAVARGRRIEKLDKKLWNTFMNSPLSPTVTALPWDETMAELCQNDIPSVANEVQYQKLQPVSEEAGQRVLKSFLTQRGESYWGSISSPNTAWFHGSRLSPHLAWGTISLRNVFQQAQKKLDSSDANPSAQWIHSLNAFSSRLYWHDHFMQKLESFPELEFHASDRRYAQVSYRDNDMDLWCWLNGRTGFPMVDATMRCLAQTGFVNFRMRAMVVSFAAFGLHLSWRTIMYPFARLMADYEPGIHIYQVQMQSGVTKGRAMRVYNPVKQMFDKDSESTFIKKWIPELRPFTSTQIYEHMNTAEKFGSDKRRSLGDYVQPITHFGRRSREMKEQLQSCVRKPKQVSSLQMQIF